MQKSFSDMAVTKVDKGERLVFGWGMINTKKGEAYYDTDNQHFPKAITVKACADYMRNARVHKAMHAGEQVGEVVFMWPAHDDIMKSLGFEPIDQEGMLVCVQVDSDDVLEKFHNGTYNDFSVGGGAVFEDVE